VTDRAPDDGLVPMAAVTVAVLVVRLPYWSRICTLGAGLIGAPAAVALGWVANASLAAAAGVTVWFWVAAVSAVAAAVTVGVPALVSP